MIYLDNCATTKPRREVVEGMVDALENEYANPSSLHRMGMQMEQKIESVRKDIANYLNVPEAELYFTSGGTEGNNIAIQAVAKANKRKGNKIITSNIEHASVENVYKHLAVEGYEVVYLKSDEYGIVDLNQLEAELDENTILVSLVHVNNELGAINDIATAGKMIKGYDSSIHFHVDGVQALGKIELNLKELKVDSYSVSAHKIHGPKGIGALYLKANKKFEPIVFGGNQESGLRSGTENTSSIIGFGIAVDYLREHLNEEIGHKEKLRAHLVERVLSEIEDVRINTDLEHSASAIVNMSFLNTRGEVILHFLENEEIYISTGSACSSNSRTSHAVLGKLGFGNDIVESSIRVCTSYEITLEDIDVFVNVLKDVVGEIRSITMR